MRPTLLIMMAALFALASNQGFADEPRDPWTTVVDWSEISGAFKTYLDNPTRENAAAASAVLPTTHAAMGGADAGMATEVIYAGLPLLQRDVEARTPEAIRLAFDLYSVADGALWEELDVLLGRLIRIDPEVLLGELQRRPEKLERPEGLLLNLGDPYVDRFRAQCLEIDARYLAIESIRSPSLQPAKARCLEVLSEERESCRKPPNQPMQTDDPESRPSPTAPTSMLRASPSA